MDRSATHLMLLDMFQHIPDAAQHFDIAMTRATVVDADGLPPSAPGWVESFDEWIAAAEVAELMHIHGALSPQQVLEQFESEGSRFVFSGNAAPNWASVAASFRARSPLFAGQSPGFGLITVGSQAAPFHPRSEAW